MAGVHVFQRFGFLPQCIALSERFSMHPDDVLERFDANTIYLIFLMDYERSEYQKRLEEIKDIRRKASSKKPNK